jgi:hypothetical protein
LGVMARKRPARELLNPFNFRMYVSDNEAHASFNSHRP